MFLSKDGAQRNNASAQKAHIEHMLYSIHFYNFSIFCGMNPKMVHPFILGTRHNSPTIEA